MRPQIVTSTSKDREPREAEHAAEIRWQNARFEATGFSGCRAEMKDRRGNTLSFLPVGVSQYSWRDREELVGPMIKKDGSVGERQVREYADKCVNLGPYEGLKP